MTALPDLQLFAIFAGLALLSAGMTCLMKRIGIIDRPNVRSSHVRPVPRSGGVAIVFATYFGLAILFWATEAAPILDARVLGIFIGAAILALAGFFDDLGRLQSFKSKLALQSLGCFLLFPFGVVIETLPVPGLGDVALGWLGYPITLLWVLGLTNIFNFMDGLDGLAAGTATVVAAVMMLLVGGSGHGAIALICLVLVAATIGFFVFNFPRAKIFLGDVGSQFLGFVLAALAVLAADPGAVTLPILVVPLLFFHFIFDTFFTFCRRLRMGEDVTQAHKSHLYQVLNQSGQSHARVSILHFVIALAQGAGAYVMVRLPASQQWGVFLPFLIFEIGYAVLVIKIARRYGVLDRTPSDPV